MFERVDQAMRGIGQRFMHWRVTLRPSLRWPLDLMVLAIAALMVWMELRSVLRFIGLL
jgi:hypothetical protein